MLHAHGGLLRLLSHRPAHKWCRRTERRRFVLYSMYAWSLPCILLGVTLVMDLTPTIPPSYVKPRLGVDFCWFQSTLPRSTKDGCLLHGGRRRRPV